MSAPVLHLIGDGVTTNFPVTFPFYNESDLEVYGGLDSKTLNVHYTITGAPVDSVKSLGVVSFYTAPALNEKLTIVRNTTETRLTDFNAAAYFEEKLLDGEFDNYLRMLEDTKQLVKAAPHFSPQDYGSVDGVLPPAIPHGILQVNAAGDGFDYVLMGDLPEFVDAVRRAEAARDAAEGFESLSFDNQFNAASAYLGCEAAKASANIYQSNAASAYLGCEAAKAYANTYQELSGQYANHPYGFNIPNTTARKSALHWAEQARINSNQTFESGGLFTPTSGGEYPNVSSLVKDTIYIANIVNAPHSYTFATGGLVGETIKSGDYFFYDLSSNTFKIVKVQYDLNAHDYTCLVNAVGTGAPHETLDGSIPATTAVNSRYLLTNPFGINTPVRVTAEVFLNGVWSDTGFIFSGGGYGVAASYIQGEGIVVQTGRNAIEATSNNGGGGHGLTNSITSAPAFRVHVWK